MSNRIHDLKVRQIAVENAKSEAIKKRRTLFLVSAAFGPEGHRADKEKYRSYALEIANLDRLIETLASEAAEVSTTISDLSCKRTGREKLSKVTPEQIDSAVTNLMNEHAADSLFKNPSSHRQPIMDEKTFVTKVESMIEEKKEEEKEDPDLEKMRLRFEALKKK